ncbi:MATE family efflux transporter [Streptomyces sp. wa1]|uniref:MATE family efflux transporter n=1 Tax=Streptomyces sp. wa1 TaxID=1828184 RepID=UPI003C7B3BC5
MSAGQKSVVAHTELTRRNFSNFAVVILLSSSIGVGFGAIDLIMVAPFGVTYVAAVGLADLIVMGLTAYCTGLVHVFSSRLGIAEGQRSLADRLSALFGAFAVCALVLQALAMGLALSAERFLELAGQDPELIPPAVDYIQVRLFGMFAALVWASASEALRVCDMKNLSLKIMICGFVANAALNYVFLHTDAGAAFSSPAQAVAAATVLVYSVMAVYGAFLFASRIRQREHHVARADRHTVLTEFRSMVWTSQGVGVRHLNDYMAAIIPFMFIGTLGPQVVAASAVGVKVYTMFCRVPQACVTGTSVFYSYQIGKGAGPHELRSDGKRLLAYTAVPTAIGTVVVLALSPWLVRIFGGSGEVDVHQGVVMLFAFMVTMPLYVLEATYTAILTVHQRGALLSTVTTIATYGIMIPLAWVSVFLLESAFWAIALGSIFSSLVIVLVLGRALYRDHWASLMPPSIAISQVGAKAPVSDAEASGGQSPSRDGRDAEGESSWR